MSTRKRERPSIVLEPTSYDWGDPNAPKHPDEVWVNWLLDDWLKGFVLGCLVRQLYMLRA